MGNLQGAAGDTWDQAAGCAGQSTRQPLTAVLQETASTSEPQSLRIQQFVHCCSALIPFFDHLGPVFSVARYEFQHKLSTLASMDGQLTLAEVVAGDVQAGRATTKNSPTRNLHRLMCAFLFLKLFVERLLKDESITTREAASDAYEEALAPFHTMIIRGVVRAGLLTLPVREQFLASIGETEDTMAAPAKDAVAASATLVAALQQLLASVEMPVSDVWIWPSS